MRTRKRKSLRSAGVPTGPSKNIKTTCEKMYYIDCCGTGRVIMSDDKLNAMFAEMPTLRFLLMGHPNMREMEIQQNEDGKEILNIPEGLGVSKSSFILLVDCFFGNVQLPRPGVSGSRYPELVETVATLGGCDVLYEQIKDFRPEPLTPKDDINNEYNWVNRSFHTSKEVIALREQGYSWVQTVNVQYSGGCRVDHIYRAPKNPPTHSQE